MFKWFGGKTQTQPAEPLPKPPESALAGQEPSPAGGVVTAPEASGGFAKLKAAVSMTGKALVGQVMGVFQEETLEEHAIDEIEEILIRADVGLKTAVDMTDKIRANRGRIKSPEQLKSFLEEEFTAILTPYQQASHLAHTPGQMNIYLVVGVNGAGKTTFIGKLAHRYVKAGKKVIIGAGDTFRAAAEEQLEVWAQRAGAEIIRKDGADPAAVVFDTLSQAKSMGADVVLLDTAGRLQNKFNLMEELRKIYRVIQKERPEGSVLESLLVLDATTGQNALKQAEVFKEAVDLTGVVLTKLDGSAKGGVILTIAQEHRLPVKLIGVGEGIEDLKDFNPTDFIQALFNRR
jgi:fused signal recognition particle receptor